MTKEQMKAWNEVFDLGFNTIPLSREQLDFLRVQFYTKAGLKSRQYIGVGYYYFSDPAEQELFTQFGHAVLWPFFRGQGNPYKFNLETGSIIEFNL